MIFKKANKTDKAEIQVLMDKLNLYRKNIFSLENKKFHERIDTCRPLSNKDFDKSYIFIAIDDSKKIVGFIQGSVHYRKNHKLSKLGYIDELFVEKKARGQAVATNLFSKLEIELKKQGCDHIVTHTDFENKLSQQFYLQSGLHKTTIELWKEI